MKKKGFTIIELLAVIIILAIVSLISTPIVMNTITNAKDRTIERSWDNYIRTVNTEIANKRLNDIMLDGSYNIDENGNLCKVGVDCVANDEELVLINTTGKKPTTGTVAIQDGRVVSSYTDGTNTTFTRTIVDGKNVIYTSDGSSKIKPCTVLTGDGTQVGNEIKCGDEDYFYVVESDENTIHMLTKYRLGTVGNDTKQSETNLIKVPFASSGFRNKQEIKPYWTTGAFMFDDISGDNVHPYIDKYVSYLKKEVDMKVEKGTLLNAEQEAAANNEANSGWFGKAYWTGIVSAKGADAVYGIYCASNSCRLAQYVYWVESLYIRPVIVISKDQIF